MTTSKRSLFIGAVFIITGLTGYFAGQDSVDVFNTQKAVIEGPLHLNERTKTSNCVVNNGLPDPQCTPGAVFLNATKEQVCVHGYTKTVRAVSVSLKKKVYREYGVPYPPPFGSYEADHFIPLALGGNNDIANLFPEAAEPRPGFREKDLVESYLYEQVCLENISLTSAQRAISHNWLDVYNNLSFYELERLRSKYKSWSQFAN